jgi:type VI secretion system protein ImpM
MFNRKQKNQTLIYANDLVGCIGKLPLHREFIKQGVNLPEIAALDQWYQSSYHHLTRQYSADIKSIFSSMPLHHFIYTAKPEQKIMIGSLLASHDQMDRVYPYVLFRLLENPIAYELQNTLSILYQDYFNQTEKLCYSNWNNYSLPELFQDVSTLNQTVTEFTRRDGLENTVQALRTIKLSEFIPNKKIIVKAIAALKLIKNNSNNLPICGIRFPLMGGFAAKTTVVFWLQLIYAVLPEKYPRLQIFWHAGNTHHKASLLVNFRAMAASNFYQLIDPYRRDPQLIDIVQDANKLDPEVGADAVFNFNSSLLQTLSEWSNSIGK